MQVSVIEKLKSLASESGHIDLESFQFINLDMIKDVTGPSWPTLKKKIFDVSEHFLDKRISEGDIIIRVHDGFLIVFAHISSDKAAALGQILSDGINQFFLGEESLKDLEVVSRHEHLTVDNLNEKLGSVIQANAAGGTKEDPALARTANINDLYSLDDQLKALEVYYYPVWDSGREIISSNSCIPHLNNNGFLHTKRDVLIGDDSQAATHALDMLMIERAKQSYFNFAGGSAPYMMTVSVSCRTLMHKTLIIEYFAALQDIPEQHRKFFLISVDQIPAGIPQIRLTEIFRSLKSLCRATLAHTLPGALRLDIFQEAGPALFGFKLRDFLGRAGELNQQMLGDVTRFCADARALKALVYVTGIERVEHILALKKAGVRFFIGPCIGHPRTEPQPLSTLHARSVLNLAHTEKQSA